MLGALERELDGAATWSKPEGGYFLWVDLPVDAAELLTRAEAAGVTFVKGSDFFPGGADGERSARLAFSYASPSEIDSGVSIARLASSRLTAAVQLREQHAADEPGEEREQDHPDQRRPRLGEDEVDAMPPRRCRRRTRSDRRRSGSARRA